MPRLTLFAGGRGLVELLLIFGLLRWSGERFRHLGLVTAELPRQLGIGVAFGAGLFVLQQFLGPLIDALLPASAPAGINLAPLFNDVRQYPLWVLLAVFKGGFAEELWRIFGLSRFETCWGRSGLIVAALVGSVVFGIGHTYQGLDTVIGTAIQGVLFCLIYLRRRRALEAITAHAVYDLIGITLAYILL